MVGVGAVAVADQLGVDAGAAGAGVIEFLEHEDAGALAHDEAVALLVEGAGGALGLVVASAHGLHGAEAADAQRDDGGLAAAGEHDLGVAHFEGAPGLAQGMGGGGAGRAMRDVGAAQVVDHGEHPAGHVQDEHGDHEGGEAAGAALEHDLVLFFGGAQAADARADEDPDFIEVLPGQVQAGIEQGLVAGGDGELGVAVGPAHVLGRGEARGDEGLHLGGDVGVKAGGVEGGNAIDAAAAGDEVGPHRLQGVAQGGDDTHAGDDHPAFRPVSSHRKERGSLARGPRLPQAKRPGATCCSLPRCT